MVNIKIPIKDIGVISYFMEPFKWDSVLAYTNTLGNGLNLLMESCWSSNNFWAALKQAHSELIMKYTVKEIHHDHEYYNISL